MLPTRQSSIKLFKFAGITVYLHWSWFLIVIYAVQFRSGAYSSPVWNVLECLILFGIVLMHEFGHSLACRQVGGKSDHIILWPFGGVAFVDPPPRPGATLWSIAAGPLVNVALAPILFGLYYADQHLGLTAQMPNVRALLGMAAGINAVLLCFNILPVYPLDGGQILQSLLWYVVGRAKSIFIASLIGFVGVAGFIMLAWSKHAVWLGLLSVFILMHCWRGFQESLALMAIARSGHHTGCACPSCKTPPPRGNFWRCGRCGTLFDPFLSAASCPGCGAGYGATRCLNCGRLSAIQDWQTHSSVPPILNTRG